MEMDMPSGTPWLDMPLMLHSSRDYSCSLNSTVLCEFQQGYWRFWYQADHRYALPTIAFFLSAIILFSLGTLLREVSPNCLWQGRSSRRVVGFTRWLSSRSWRMSSLNWNSAPLGVLLLGAVGIIYFFCMVLGPKPYYWPNTALHHFGDSPPLATRSGWLAMGCLPFVFATAGKSNLITLVTGVSHEKLQVFHRWISYSMYILALLHTFPFIVFHIQQGDMIMSWNGSLFYWTGVVALLAQTWLTFASMGPLRHVAYEWFKYTHFLAGLVFMLFLFFHCDYTLTSWDYFIATGVLFALSFLHRHLRIYFELGLHTASLSLAGNGFIRVSVPTKTTWRAGQHFFIRFMGLGVHALSVHPFTACSLPTRKTSARSSESELVFYIRPQGGLTRRLAQYVEKKPNGQMRVLLDGPYGGIDMEKLVACQRYVVVAGGSGAGWALPIITAFLRKSQLLVGEKNESTLRVILATRDVATRSWFETCVADTLAASPADIASNVQVEICYTGKGSNSDGSVQLHGDTPTTLEDIEKGNLMVHAQPKASEFSAAASTRSSASRVQYGEGRPDLASIIVGESTSTGVGGTLGVFVCGPQSMQSDVSNAVARKQLAIARDGSMDLYLHVEHFSWA